METMNLDPMVQKQLIHSVVIMVTALVIFFGLKRLFQYLLQRANVPTLAFRPLRLVLRYAVIVVAVAMVLNVWGIPTQTLLALLGTVLGLVAIGFVAVWSVLSNLLCTFVLIFFKPFYVGDELEFPADSVAGKVVDLTLIFTTLRGPNGEYVQIPNNLFFQRMFKRRAGAKAVELSEQLRQEKPID